MFRPEQKVHSGVHIAIMRRATTTNPRSYSQLFLTLRATACAARRTSCGTVGLFGFDVLSPVPAGFVTEHRSKLRPRRIERRFSLRSIRKRFAIDIANHDQCVLLHDPGRLHMEEMAARVSDLRVDSPGSFLVSGALRLREIGLIFIEVPRVHHAYRRRGGRVAARGAGAAAGDAGNRVP